MAGVAQLEWRRCKDSRAEENKTGFQLLKLSIMLWMIVHSGEGADRNGNENQLVYQKDQSGLTDNTTTGWAHSFEGSLIMDLRKYS